MKISIIIVSYNVRELLKSCLHSLEKFWPQDYSFEIIILDNCSKDGTVEMVKKEFPHVHLIESKNNLGFSIGNNEAAKIASGESLFFLNPDTELIDDSMKMFLDDYFSEEGKRIYAPRLLNTNGTVQRSLIKFPGVWQMFGELFYLTHIIPGFKIIAEKIRDKKEVEAISGAALLIDRNYFTELKMFDANLFWMEDVDLCLKNKIAGGKNVYFPLTEIVHHSGQSSTKSYTMVIANQLLSKVKFINKYSNQFQKIAIVIVCNMHMMARILVFSFLALFQRSYLKKAHSYFACLKIVNSRICNKDLSIYIEKK